MLDDYYSSRLDVIEFYTRLSKKIAKLRLRGMSSWKPKHYKLMYALHNGTLLSPDRMIRSIMDPKAYPGTDGSSVMSTQDAKQRGIFNIKYLFGFDKPSYNYREDPFTLMSDRGDQFYSGNALNFPPNTSWPTQ